MFLMAVEMAFLSAAFLLLAPEDLSIPELYEKAELARKEGREKEALAGFQQLLARQRDHLEGNLGYQKLLQSQKKEPQLVQEYGALLEKHPEPWCYYLYGRLLHDPKKEEELYARGLAKDPRNAPLQRAQGSVLWQQKRLEEAIGCYTRALEIEPRSRRTYVSYIELMDDAGRIEKLIVRFRKECESRPDDFLPHLLHAVALIVGDSDRGLAKKHLEAAVRLAPENRAVHHSMAVYYLKQKQPERAIESLDKALEIDPHHAYTLYLLGSARVFFFNDKDGVASVLEATRLEPGNSGFFSDLGAIYMTRGDPDAVERYLEEAFRLDRTNDAAISRMAVLRSQQKKHAEALEWIRKAIALDDKEAAYQSQLGSIYRSLGQNALAQEAFQTAEKLKGKADFGVVVSGREVKVVEESERKAQNLYSLALSLLFEGETEKARTQLQAALRDDPGLKSAHYLLGRIHQRLGEPETALEYYTRLVDLLEKEEKSEKGRGARASIRIADCLYDLGREEEASKLYRGILERDPDGAPKSEALASIVQHIDQAPEDSTVLRLSGVRISECAKESYCVPKSLSAVFKHWKIPGDVRSLGRDLVKDGGPSLKEVCEYLQRKGLDTYCFLPDTASLKDLVRRDYPVVLCHFLLYEGTYMAHASVVVGFDDRRGVFLLEDSNWYRGWDRVAYSQLEGVRALLVGPPGSVRSIGENLRGQDFCATLNEAEALMGEGRKELAEERLRTAILLQPKDSRSHSYLGRLARERGDIDQALASLEKAIRLPGADAETYTRLGALYFELGQVELAAESLHDAELIEPRYYVAQKLLATLYTDGKEYERALVHAESLVRIRPTDGEARFMYARLLDYTGEDRDKAAWEFRQAVFYGGPNESHRYLADCYRREGRDTRAIEELRKYLAGAETPEQKKEATELLEGWDAE